MRIAIVGPGSMGCLFSAYLAEAGHEITLIDYRHERAETINANGVSIEIQGEEKKVPVSASADPAAAKNADGVIFTVKAYSTETAAARLSGFISDSAWTLTLQNGMGNTDILQKYFGAERTLAGTTSEGANLKGPASVRHAGKGETWLGELDGRRTERIESIAKAFSDAGFKTGVTDNVSILLWKKLLVNIGINPITALLKIKNGEILKRPSAISVSHSAVEEALLVAKADGMDFGDLDTLALVDGVAQKTCENISSMHQDAAAGRITEIDFICGYTVRLGEKLGIPTPVNRTLLDLVSALDRGN